MAARRIQISLTEEQRERLGALREQEGKSLAELVREALDAYLADAAPDPADALAATFGSVPRLTPPSRDEWDPWLASSSMDPSVVAPRAGPEG